jgi:hypothetical protein
MTVIANLLITHFEWCIADKQVHAAIGPTDQARVGLFLSID